MTGVNETGESKSKGIGSLRNHLFRGGLAALVIKISAAGLSYVMFVVLARIMSGAEYGWYAFGFSLAMFFSFVVALGQPTAILRFWPQYIGENRLDKAKGVFVAGIAAISGGTVLAAVLISSVAVSTWLLGQTRITLILLAAAALSFPIAASEYLASAIRVLGHIIIGLAPKDIAWRLAVIAAAGWAATSGYQLSGLEVLWLSSVLLVVAVVPQGFYSFRLVRARTGATPAAYDFPLWRTVGFGLWAVAAVDALSQNAGVFAIGLVISPEEAGPYFAAARTASLISLPLVAANMVGVPIISKLFHSGEQANLQRTCRLMCIGAAVPSLVGFILFAVWGKEILAVFGGNYSSAYDILIILGFAQVVNSACGPTGFLMQMTGHERSFVRILLICNCIGLLALLVLTFFFGAVGAAIGAAGSIIGWNLWVRGYCIKFTGIDPTITCLSKAMS